MLGYLYLGKVLIFILVSTLLYSNGWSSQISWVITLPDPCHEVERVEENKVYITTPKEKSIFCIQKISYREIAIDEKYDEIEIYLNNKFLRKEKRPEVPQNLYLKESEPLALQSYDYFQSREFQEKLAKYREEIHSLFDDLQKEKDTLYSDLKTKESLPENSRIYIFISSSVPQETVRNYVKQGSVIDHEKVILVLRGGIKSGLKELTPTIKWSFEVLRKDPSCVGECEMYPLQIIIDPFLFKKYKINTVPSIVYVPNINKADFGNSEGLSELESEYYISYGDVSLKYHLYKINKYTKDTLLKHIIERLPD